jgi:hypothetical protein
MNSDSINGPLSLALSPSEGERVLPGRVPGFRVSKRERSPWGILSPRERAGVKVKAAADWLRIPT